MAELKLAENLRLPADAVTQTNAVLAIRGVGKTYLSSVLAEEMLAAGNQVVVIDPTGAWWGLQTSADGKQPAFSIAVFGGDHANVPLEESAGEIIATAIVQNRFSAILDLSHFRKGQMCRFMSDFLETLYRLNREAMHLIIDEADSVAPQRVMANEARMCGAAEVIVKRGRIRGIGCTMITQRPAALNKNVLTQCESLFAMRLNHPRDISAIKEWVDVHSTPKESAEVIDSLPSLEIGTAWFWSPGWLQKLVKIKVRPRTTFDSSATPKAGKTQARPKALAAVDLNVLGEQIKSSVEQAKANDPKELRRQLADLRKQLDARGKQTAKVDQSVIDRAWLAAAGARRRETKELLSTLVRVQKSVGDLGRTLADAIERVERIDSMGATPDIPKAAVPTPLAAAVPMRAPAAARVTAPAGDSPLPKGETAVLTALIQYPNGLERQQLTTLTGYKKSTRDSYIKRLREKEHVDVRGNTIVATDAGRAALPDAQPLPRGQELQEFWFSRLPAGERSILQVLVNSYPNSRSRDDLTAETGYKKSTRDSYIKRLRAKELVDVTDVGVRANELLF